MLEEEPVAKAIVTENFNSSNSKLKCPICSKNYAVKDSLKVHMMTIHEKKMSFQCSYGKCTKSYFNLHKLTCHIRTHTGERPYECSRCTKKFTTKGNLSTHFKLHNNPQKFQCGTCHKHYTSKGNLENHKNIVHLKLRKHICHLCKQPFGRASSLKTHLIVHSGEKPFVCHEPNCGKRYAEKGNLLMHQRNKHSDFNLNFSKGKKLKGRKTGRETEMTKRRCTLMSTDVNEDSGTERLVNQSINHFEINSAFVDDKFPEGFLSNILASERENSMDYYLPHLPQEQDEENYTESATYESSMKITFNFDEDINLANGL